MNRQPDVYPDITTPDPNEYYFYHTIDLPGLGEMQQASQITRETLIITEVPDNNRQSVFNRLFNWLGESTVRKLRNKRPGPSMIFRPDVAVGHPEETW